MNQEINQPSIIKSMIFGLAISLIASGFLITTSAVFTGIIGVL